MFTFFYRSSIIKVIFDFKEKLKMPSINIKTYTSSPTLQFGFRNSSRKVQ